MTISENGTARTPAVFSRQKWQHEGIQPTTAVPPWCVSCPHRAATWPQDAIFSLQKLGEWPINGLYPFWVEELKTWLVWEDEAYKNDMDSCWEGHLQIHFILCCAWNNSSCYGTYSTSFRCKLPVHLAVLAQPSSEKEKMDSFDIREKMKTTVILSVYHSTTFLVYSNLKPGLGSEQASCIVYYKY